MHEEEQAERADEPAESGALEPPGEGGRAPAEPQQDPVESGGLEDDRD